MPLYLPEPESDDESCQPQAISYQSKLNLQRFQDFLQEEEKLSAHMDPPSLVSQLNKEEEDKKNNSAQQEAGSAVEMKSAAAAASTSSGMDKEKGQMMHLLASLLNQGKTDTANDAQMLSVLVNAVAGRETVECQNDWFPN